GRLPVNALVGRYPTNKLIGRDPIPCRKSLSHTRMRSCGTSGITTRFQELFRCMGQVGHALLTRSPLSPRQQAARDPVRLACVKHAASVHPEPESNPPQKNLHGKPTNGPQKRKKTDHPCKAKNGHTKNPDTHQTPSGTTRAGIGLAIKNHKPHPHGCDPWQVVQYTLLSSQTTKHSQRTHREPTPAAHQPAAR
ncbi:peptide YY, partial [Bifidobacterium pseudolongum subsp. globosum]